MLKAETQRPANLQHPIKALEYLTPNLELRLLGCSADMLLVT